MQIPSKPWEPSPRMNPESRAEVEVIPQNGAYIVRVQGQIQYCQKAEEALAYIGSYFGLVQPTDSLLIYTNPKSVREMHQMLWAEVANLKIGVESLKMRKP